ncbi:MAG: type II secretion system protein [Candidatus Kerfeldbacteria bacterium]|nr:type II secretion system protein [Candidatus Kerfeldbacteria bacterium]
MIRSRTGFTLLEVVLALGIFAILSVVVIDVYFSSGREERRGVARSQGAGSARFALEVMAREARLGVPDYAYYVEQRIPLVDGSGNPRALSMLAVVLPDNTTRVYRCVTRGTTSALAGDVACPASNGELQRSLTGAAGTWESLTIEEAEVTSFQVFVTPSSDPFPADSTVNQQPKTTVSLVTVGIGNVEDEVRTHFQTTVSSRNYVR